MKNTEPQRVVWSMGRVEASIVIAIARPLV